MISSVATDETRKNTEPDLCLIRVPSVAHFRHQSVSIRLAGEQNVLAG
jgi:hypothetical protein